MSTEHAYDYDDGSIMERYIITKYIGFCTKDVLMERLALIY